MPAERMDTATLLRQLEQSAPAPCPRNIRAAMIQAATELEDLHKLLHNAANQLDEASNLRISAMASATQADEVHRQTKRTMTDLARVFRELS